MAELLEPTDTQLLARFVLSYDESAFKILVERYTPIVIGVCYRVLENSHDAEEASQSTFLTLSRKAASIRKKESLGGWLYRVAYRTALEMKSRAILLSKRTSNIREDMMSTLQSSSPSSSEKLWEQVQPILDEELNRLPEKYRTPIILCYLEGKTSEEVAKELGLTPALIWKRLERARNCLRNRFVKRGMALSSSLLITLLVEKAAASVPNELVESIVKAVACYNTATSTGTFTGIVSTEVIALTETVVKTMSMEALKVRVLTLLAVAGIIVSGILAVWQTSKIINRKPTVSAVVQIQPHSPAEKTMPNSLDQSFLMAVKEGDLLTVKALLNEGANPNTQYSIDYEGGKAARVPALTLAVGFDNLEIVKVLLKNGANINAKGDSGFTALRIAVTLWRPAVIKVLLANGADINDLKADTAVELTTVIRMARKRGDTDVADLLEEAMVNSKTSRESSKIEE